MSLKQESDGTTAGNTASELGASAKPPSDGEQKRPYLTKFATIHTDRYPHIRRDFPHNNYDRNLTIEKAHFEPHPTDFEADSIDNPPQPSPPHESPPLASSASTTALSSTTSTITPASSKALPTKSKSEPDRSSRTTKRRRRPPPPVSGTATPSEVFHRNLIDAVSNVEDSDENEQYVYPYSTNHNDQTYHSAKGHAQPSVSPVYDSRLGGFLADIFRRGKPHKPQDEEVGSPGHRPRLRSYVMDRPPQRPKDTTFSTHLYKGDNHDGRTSPRFRSSRRVGDGYTSDDEGASLLRLGRADQDSISCPRMLRNMLVTFLTLGALILLLIMYRAKPLMDVSVGMGRVLASDKELIFDLHVTASNLNWWTMRVEDADISMFAFSQVVPMQANATASEGMHGVDPAEYLGSCHHFDEPLSFRPNLFSNRAETAITQIRIKSPGADKSGNERWSRIIRYPYGLVARGVLKYQRLPFGGLRRQSSSICDVAQVDPTTGDVSEDPDQGFCLSYAEPS